MLFMPGFSVVLNRVACAVLWVLAGHVQRTKGSCGCGRMLAAAAGVFIFPTQYAALGRESGAGARCGCSFSVLQQVQVQ